MAFLFLKKKPQKNEFLGKKETKMTRKIIALVLAMVMCLGLAACGSEPENDNVLRVAMECAYAPYNWTQNDDSNGAVPIAGTNSFAYGYDVMMAKLIAESMGKELEIVKLDWDALVPAVDSGDVDLVIAGQSITAERLEVVDFSDPYFYASIVTLTKADSAYASATSVADLAGAVCTSQLGTIWYDICLPQIPDADIQNAQENAPAMLVALDSGAVDLVVTDMPTAMAATAVYSDMVLLDFTGTEGEFEVSEEEINLGISMKKGNAELLEAVNGVLATMTVEDYEAMMQEAIAVQPLSE
ncbi:MAG: transporter substrate-binding domain-containing protein [Oscillospiraceae bacterium]|nr:transporter substrate-binding domain-containing protein [Oscillospiraceae bacterium]